MTTTMVAMATTRPGARPSAKAAKLAKSRENLTQIGFPVFLRFVDLEAAGIVQSWAQLGHLVKDEKFPVGVMFPATCAPGR